jgi:hypothetical protein
VAVTFVPGNNVAGLQLNPSYNGATDSLLLIPGQSLTNQTSINTDYFFKINISFRVTNLNAGEVYMNSAIGSATIGSANNLSLINVSDSSNNGTQAAVDPNNNGNAKEAGENVPTPFSFGVLPVRFISITASVIDKTSSVVNWVVATPSVNAGIFKIEYSADGSTWHNVGWINIDNVNQSSYSFIHNNIPTGDLYYRVRQVDEDGEYIYSNVVLLRRPDASEKFTIFPNPANNYITVRVPFNIIKTVEVTLYDVVGKQLFSELMTSSTKQINTANFPNGAYLLKVTNDGTTTSLKVLIMHP